MQAVVAVWRLSVSGSDDDLELVLRHSCTDPCRFYLQIHRV